MRKLIAKVTSILLMASFVVSLCGCSKGEVTSGPVVNSTPYMEYLGDYEYATTPVAMVFEPVEDEEGMMGIQYRKVEDLGGLSTQDQIAVCLYFYSSLNNSAASLTAGVEDLAQTLDGKVLFVAINVAEHEDISKAYNVYECPEFILINKSVRVATFNSSEREAWTVGDVAQWLINNGYNPDYSKLD